MTHNEMSNHLNSVSSTALQILNYRSVPATNSQVVDAARGIDALLTSASDAEHYCQIANSLEGSDRWLADGSVAYGPDGKPAAVWDTRPRNDQSAI